MDAETFLLVRDMLRSFVARHHTETADVKPTARAAAQAALAELGLGDLRRSTPPAAGAQECALLAEDHGAEPMTTSLLGTVLLAPELLRLLGDGAETGGTTPTIALTRDLRFPGATPTAASRNAGAAPAGLVAWDCEGADHALCVAADGTVTAVGLGPAAPTTDLLRAVRAVRPGGPVRAVGRLDPAAQRRWQAYALVMVASELTGAARTLVGRSVEYARERRQYGREIGSFQAVQHLLADATVQVEACTSAVRYAAWCLDHEPPERALTAARAAKAEVNDSAVEAVKTAAQVFGGIAQTWEHTAHLYLRRVLVGATTLATSADLLTALAEPEAAR